MYLFIAVAHVWYAWMWYIRVRGRYSNVCLHVPACKQMCKLTLSYRRLVWFSGPSPDSEIEPHDLAPATGQHWSRASGFQASGRSILSQHSSAGRSKTFSTGSTSAPSWSKSLPSTSTPSWSRSGFSSSFSLGKGFFYKPQGHWLGSVSSQVSGSNAPSRQSGSRKDCDGEGSQTTSMDEMENLRLDFLQRVNASDGEASDPFVAMVRRTQLLYLSSTAACAALSAVLCIVAAKGSPDYVQMVVTALDDAEKIHKPQDRLESRQLDGVKSADALMWLGASSAVYAAVTAGVAVFSHLSVPNAFDPLTGQTLRFYLLRRWATVALLLMSQFFLSGGLLGEQSMSAGAWPFLAVIYWAISGGQKRFTATVFAVCVIFVSSLHLARIFRGSMQPLRLWFTLVRHAVQDVACLYKRLLMTASMRELF